MRLEHKSEKELKKEIIQIAEKYLDLNKYQLFFFGSRVSGKGDSRSDIDLGIKGNKRLSAEISENIKDDLENLPTLYSIDFVDFENVSKDFRELAEKNIEYLN